MAQVHAQTETAVACEALSHLLLPAITDLDADTSQSGKVLRKHFASVRYTYAYALPNDPYCLAARNLYCVHIDSWKLNGRRILSNVGPTVTLIYTARVLEVPLWDAMFRTAFALALAVACKELCKDEDTVAIVQRAAADALTNAWPVDAAEGVPDQMPELEITAVRGAGSTSRRRGPWDS